MSRTDFKPGDICKCRHGYIGLIIHEAIDRTQAERGQKWCGIHLHPDRWGQRWESVDPEFLYHFSDLTHKDNIDG